MGHVARIRTTAHDPPSPRVLTRFGTREGQVRPGAPRQFAAPTQHATTVGAALPRMPTQESGRQSFDMRDRDRAFIE